MNIGELFDRNPLTWTIRNEGVANNNSDDEDTLRYELETFVCEGEYEVGIRNILEGYLSNLDRQQHAAWVSGFYGSGKSHLVKVLRYLWTNYEFKDGATARDLANLPSSVTDALSELSTIGQRGAGLHAAGGTLNAGAGDIRHRLLGFVFKSVGLPEALSQARLVMDMQEEDIFEAVQKEIRGQGREPSVEIGRMYTSKVFQDAFLKYTSHLNDVETVAQAIRQQYPTGSAEITIDEMLSLIERALVKNGTLPHTLFVLDEVQQFISNNQELVLQIQDVVESVSTGLDGKVLFVGTGQSALTDTPELQKLMGRFTIKVHLRDTDVEKVVRTVVLKKKPDHIAKIEKLFAAHDGEVSRQLRSTTIGTSSADREEYAADYPLLPVRRRFWERVLHSTDTSGTSAQMRTQLRVTHEAVKSVAEKQLGAVIPGDFLYDQLANTLVISGAMQRRFQEIIDEQSKKPDGELRRRICATVFMINSLPSGIGSIGVHANAEHISDLLAEDLENSSTELRSKLPDLLDALRKEGTLMEVDGEYRLQTTEGARWEQHFQSLRSPKLNDQAFIARERNQLLDAAIHKRLSNMSVQHGEARVSRRPVVHYGPGVPTASDGPVIWVRDGFQEQESSIISQIQSLNIDDPSVHVVVPQSNQDSFRGAIAAASAADETLNFMGMQTTEEGQDARASMASRQAAEKSRIEDTVQEIVSGARVYLSGGQQITTGDLESDVREAVEDTLGRLFPKFGIADSASWPTVLSRAKQGNADALSALKYTGDPEKHPVASLLMTTIGAGKKGGELVSHFGAPPYGWPKDCIDATLLTLLVSGHLAGRLNGMPTNVDELDQRKINQADFKVQHPVLTAPQKVKIRQLFQKTGHNFTTGAEAQAAYGFIDTVKGLLRRTGGAPPAPLPQDVPELSQLEGLSGNDLMFELFGIADGLISKIDDFINVASKLETRLSSYESTLRLLAAAPDIQGHASHETSLAAIAQDRTILVEPDPLESVRQAISSEIRHSLNEAHKRYIQKLDGHRQRLNAHPAWIGLDDQSRQKHLNAVGVIDHSAPAVASEDDLLDSLQTRNLAAWKSETDALQSRFDQALSMVLKELEPEAKKIQLQSATIHSADELDAWLDKTRSLIETALDEGPVIL